MGSVPPSVSPTPASASFASKSSVSAVFVVFFFFFFFSALTSNSPSAAGAASSPPSTPSSSFGFFDFFFLARPLNRSVTSSTSLPGAGAVSCGTGSHQLANRSLTDNLEFHTRCGRGMAFRRCLLRRAIHFCNISVAVYHLRFVTEGNRLSRFAFRKRCYL